MYVKKERERLIINYFIIKKCIYHYLCSQAVFPLVPPIHSTFPLENQIIPFPKRADTNTPTHIPAIFKEIRGKLSRHLNKIIISRTFAQPPNQETHTRWIRLYLRSSATWFNWVQLTETFLLGLTSESYKTSYYKTKHYERITQRYKKITWDRFLWRQQLARLGMQSQKVAMCPTCWASRCEGSASAPYCSSLP
jgi:hypothetical protein